MAVKHYKGAQELELSTHEQEVFDDGIQQIRSKLRERGFSGEAVDALGFKLTKHALQISPEEAHGGAFHVFADGKPFCAVQLTAPGSLMDMTGNSSRPTTMPAKSQRAFLAFELGINILGNMGQALEAMGLGKGQGGGIGGPVAAIDMETTFRCPPAVYMDVLNQMVDMRLDQIVPKPAPAPQARPAPGNGPRP